MYEGRGYGKIEIILFLITTTSMCSYMNRHRDPTFATSFPEASKWPIHVQVSHFATIACRRLDRIGSTGKKQAKKPNEDEINQARVRVCALISNGQLSNYFRVGTGPNIPHQHVRQHAGRSDGTAKGSPSRTATALGAGHSVGAGNWGTQCTSLQYTLYEKL